MFGLDSKTLLLIILVAVAVAALVYFLLFDSIDAERQTETRMSRLASGSNNVAQKKAANDRLHEMSKRKRSVQDSLKEIEDKQKDAKPKAGNLKSRITQAGLSISPKKYYTFAILTGVFFALCTFVASGDPLIALGVMFVTTIGLPAWFLSFLRKRRFKAFLNELPNALDVMVRSIKSGLPLNDSIRLISTEGSEPVKGEFLRVVEAQQVGLSIPEACQRLYTRIPLPEVNFFSVVINIQAQAGGNLSEALGNLSAVLRARKQMKAKVKALSMEAKASAAIIGALPFIVTILVYISSPAYITLLFTDQRGHLIIGASLLWMTIGVLVMRKMIDFEV
jgi:tight adherence protein B